MNLLPYPRLTPWVGRLIVINATVLLLMQTLLTSPVLRDALMFTPTAAISHPWTFVTYMFVHAGLVHFLLNFFALFVFGAAVESRMGSRQFIFFYLYCGIGAAIIAMLLGRFITVAPFFGASGAVLGVMVAFAMFWPDAEMVVFPIPAPIRARTLVIALIAIDLVFALWPRGDGLSHPAHLGGALAGWLFLRMQLLSRGAPAEPTRTVERAVMVQSGAGDEHQRERRTPVTPIRQHPRAEPDTAGVELDRLLDKISAQGIASLTAAERRFLDETAKRKAEEKR